MSLPSLLYVVLENVLPLMAKVVTERYIPHDKKALRRLFASRLGVGGVCEIAFQVLQSEKNTRTPECWCVGLVFRCSGVLVYWCAGVLVLQCAVFLVYLCAGVLVYWCSSMLVCWRTGVLVCWCTGVLVFWCSGVLVL